jgi:hypothetical protein
MEKLKNISIGSRYNHVSNPILTKNKDNLITISYENSTINEDIPTVNNIYYNTSVKSYKYNQKSKLLEDDQLGNINNVTTSINAITINDIDSMKRSRTIAYNENSKVYCFAHYENFKKPYKIGKVIINTSNILQKLTSLKFEILELNGEYLNNIRGKPILIPFKNGFLCIFQTHDDKDKYSNIYCQELTTSASDPNTPIKLGELKSITYYGFEPCVTISKNIYNKENVLITWLELPESKKGYPVSFGYNEELRLRGKIITHSSELKPSAHRGGDFLIPLETGIDVANYDVQHSCCVGINNKQLSVFFITGTSKNDIINKNYILKTAVFKYDPTGGYIDHYTKKPTGQLLFDKSGSLSTHKRKLNKIHFPINNIFPEKSLVMVTNNTTICILFHRKIKNNKNEDVLQLVKIESDHNGVIPSVEGQGEQINETICDKDSFNPNVISLNKEFIVTYEKCEKGLKPSIEVEPIMSNFRDLKKQMHKKMRNMRFDLLRFQ